MKPVPFYNILKSNIIPFPGRAALTWRIALLCAVMAVFAMVYEIPESAISCYLIIYLMKIDASENVILAIVISILLTLTVLFIFIVTNLTINSPFLRIFAIFCCSYFFVFWGARFGVSHIGNLVALVIAFLLTLLSVAPTGEIATRGILYALLMATSPMFLMIIFNLTIGKKSRAILIEKLSYRITVIQQIIKEPAKNREKFDLLLKDSLLDCETHLKLIKILHLQSKKDWHWLDNLNTQTHKLLALSTVIPKETSSITRSHLIDYCQQLLATISKQNININITLLQDSLVVEELCNTFNRIVNVPAYNAPKKSKKKPSAKIKEKLHTLPFHYFAFKVTISALICYFLYTVLDWSGIHTAMITCYVVALGTTAETIHKLLLRILGCLIGALMGVLAIIYIVPHLETSAGLFVLIFIGMLLPAWVAVGSDLFSYGGVQIGLAFLLTVLNGFSPSTDLVVAQDRILGILLGNVICFVVFTYLWPVSLAENIYIKITKILKLSGNENTSSTDLSDFVKLTSDINDIDYDLKLVIFDTHLMKLSDNEVKILYILIRKLSLLNVLLLLPIDENKKMAYRQELLFFLKDNLINGNNINNINKLNRLLHKNIMTIAKDIQIGKQYVINSANTI